MTNIDQILSFTAPIFILIGLGFLSVKSGWLAKEHTKGLSWFVVSFAIPAAIFKALSSRSIIDILQFDYLLVYGLGSLTAFAVLMSVSLTRKKSLTQSAFFGLGGSMSNSLMIGFPIIYPIFGDAALVPFALTLVIENLLILPLALALADTGQKKGVRFMFAIAQSLLQLFKNPIILAIIFGLLASYFEVGVPKVATTVIDMLAATVGAVALFSVGAMLVGHNPKGMFTDITLVSIGKLVLHPLAVIVMIMILPPIPPLYQSVAVILASMPMFGVYPVLASRYGLSGTCSSTLFVTTLASVITTHVFLFFWGGL